MKTEASVSFYKSSPGHTDKNTDTQRDTGRLRQTDKQTDIYTHKQLNLSLSVLPGVFISFSKDSPHNFNSSSVGLQHSTRFSACQRN